MHGKLKKTPKSFTGSNPTYIQIQLDLILASSKLHSGSIMSFVDVLVNIFDGLHRIYRFHINVTSVSPKKIRVVRNHPSVVHLYATTDLMYPPIISPSINSIGILR